MQFDFTSVTDQGFVILPPGRYAVVTTDEWWLRRKEGSENTIIDIDVEVTAGKYKGETTRYFHTITNTDQTLGFLLRFLRAIGLIRDGDRGAKGELRAEFIYGEKDDRDRVRLKTISVNGEERSVAGNKAIAVLTEYTDNATGDKRSRIARFEPVEPGGTEAASDIPAAKTAATGPGGSPWPF